MNAAFFEAVRSSLFGGSLSQQQVDGINFIIRAWEMFGDGDSRKLAYLLGTAKHETANTMEPVRETLASTDAKAKAILTKSWKAGKLPWVKSDYWSGGFFGRGYVQLTHKANYEKAGKALGIDLVKDPSLAMKPVHAAEILVRGCMLGWFTGKRLADYITPSTANYVDARRVVNGTDRATLIAGYALQFELAVKKGLATPKPAAAPPIPPKPQTPASEPRKGGKEGLAYAAALIAAAVMAAVATGWGNFVNFIQQVF